MALLALPVTAHAHRIGVFASVSDGRISGEVYFPSGGAAAGVKVVARAPDGRVLGEAVSDADGRWQMPVRFRCDHELAADAGEGHRATYLVPASDLPANLPALPGAGGPAAPPPAAPPELEAAASPDIEAAVERAVARQVEPLRRDLARYQDSVRVHDVLGGIGYVLGLMGLAFYFLGARRRASRAAGRQ
jgi:nickel transport protein